MGEIQWKQVEAGEALSHFQKQWTGRLRKGEGCSLTSTSNAGCSGEGRFAIGGHSEHTRRQHLVLYLTLYVLTTEQSTTQSALFVLVKSLFFIKPFIKYFYCP